MVIFRNMLKLWRPLLLMASLAAALPGQTVNGSINGTITDSTGAVIPAVTIEVLNTTTGVHREAVSSSSGTYTVPLLPPGSYEVTVRKQGMSTEIRRGVSLLVNQNLTLDFQLSPGAVSQSVQVTSEVPLVDATSATLGQVIEHQQIVDLPLNGRSFTQLVLLTPGAAPAEAPQQNTLIVKEGAGSISPSVNGQRGQQNNFTMDGVLNNALYTNTWAIAPPPDAVQEFNVQSHMTDAEFSISSGANINLVTRSGSNQFHGSLWEFFRNDKLDARNFFDPQRAPYRQNQYGVFFSGPVRLPHFNGKDNTWFSIYWEGFRSRQSASYFATVPTSAMRNGDFSAFPQAAL